jgi:putative Mn2+ efflux pump MntP
LEILAGILFCCSVSFDAFTIGCSYGLRNFKSSFSTNIIITVVSATFTALALFCGKLILLFVPAQTGLYLGAGFLMLLGLYTIISGLFSKKPMELNSFCRKISLKESLFMAVALSIDAFSAGIGYGISGHISIFIPIGVGLTHSIFLSLGIVISRKTISNLCFSKKILSLLSGIIIIIVGLSRLFLQ